MMIEDYVLSRLVLVLSMAWLKKLRSFVNKLSSRDLSSEMFKSIDEYVCM